MMLIELRALWATSLCHGYRIEGSTPVVFRIGEPRCNFCATIDCFLRASLEKRMD
jgi:hypothetical protein